MKKISQINWKRYKDSESGKEAIEAFNKILTTETSLDQIVTLAKRFDPAYFKNYSNREIDAFIERVQRYNEIICKILSENEIKLVTYGNFMDFYVNILYMLTATMEDQNFDDIPQSSFKYILNDNLALSIILYAYLPGFFIPNFMVSQFMYIEKFAEKYDIEFPKMPKRSDYKSRCLYYSDICLILNTFFDENEFDSTAEICAFIYDYEFPLIKEEMESNMFKDLPGVPEQAWLLVGNYSEGERNMESGLWQANQFTCKGDVLMFYEKSPVKKMNSVWIALEDGRIDPFAYYYSYTYIGRKIEIPDDQAITFQEFKDSEYFKVENRGKKGNYVSKNFQDTSGWPIPFDDYKEMKNMLSSKGFDTSLLPSLYEPEGISAEHIENEDDVYAKLVTPLLEQMGWEKDKDFKREVEFAAGHSTTGHAMNKRPDYCLHLSYNGKKVYAKVVIEAKYFIKNNIELHETFDQCVSYACWGNAKVLVLCDKNSVYVYEQNRNGEFEEGHHKTRYRWTQMKDPEIFKELKRKLDI